MKRWILVCDAAKGLLFEDGSPTEAYRHLETLEHPESAAHVRDLVSDANGRKPVGPSFRGAGGGGHSNNLGVGRPGAAPNTDPKTIEAEKFARDIVHTLEQGLVHQAYESLVIAAPPKFLGLLKEVAKAQVSKHIELTIPKDLSKLDTRSIEEHIRREISAHQEEARANA